jgi:hypothetical protein
VRTRCRAIHVPDDNTFRLAYTLNNSAIYSYKMHALTGTSWAGTGDIYNNPDGYVSSVTLTARQVASGATQPYAWFIKYR